MLMKSTAIRMDGNNCESYSRCLYTKRALSNGVSTTVVISKREETVVNLMLLQLKVMSLLFLITVKTLRSAWRVLNFQTDQANLLISGKIVNIALQLLKLHKTQPCQMF